MKDGWRKIIIKINGKLDYSAFLIRKLHMDRLSMINSIEDIVNIKEKFTTLLILLSFFFNKIYIQILP